MTVIVALALLACAPPGPAQPTTPSSPEPAPQAEAPPAPRPRGDGSLLLRAGSGGPTITTDVDAWLAVPDSLAGERTVPLRSRALELLTRSGARRSTDGVAHVEVGEDAAGADVLHLAETLQRAGYRVVGFRPRGTGATWRAASRGPEGAGATFQQAWQAAERRSPEAPLLLAGGPDVPVPEQPFDPTVPPAWGEADAAQVQLDLTPELTRLHLDPTLARLHPGLGVGPIEVAYGPQRDAELLAALDYVWAATELTGRAPGPMLVDVRLTLGAPDGGAASVGKRLRERRPRATVPRGTPPAP